MERYFLCEFLLAISVYGVVCVSEDGADIVLLKNEPSFCVTFSLMTKVLWIGCKLPLVGTAVSTVMVDLAMVGVLQSIAMLALLGWKEGILCYP